MRNNQNTSNDEDRIAALLQRSGENIINLVLDANLRIDGYPDEIIGIKQGREEKDK